MYIGTGVPRRLMLFPLISVASPNGLKFLNVMYNGSIIVLVGITIMTTTHANNNFLNGKLNLANPYPTIEQISTCITINDNVYNRSLPIVGK